LLLSLPAAWGVLYELSRTDWLHGPNRRVGKVLFSKSSIIAMTLTLTAIGSTFLLFGWDRPLWFEILRLTVFVSIVPVLYWQWWAYRKERRHPTVLDLERL
jgi:membrane protein implicated in regulation of membrane protease activity